MEVEEKIDIKLKYSVEEELPKILELFKIQSPTGQEYQMRNYLKGVCSNIENTIVDQDKYGNLFITKGVLKSSEDYYPCIVAHMDGVHSFEKGYKIKKVKTLEGTKLYAECDNRPLVYNSFRNYTSGFNIDFNKSTKAGIAGDDKCGIWLALKMLQTQPILKVVFTVEEESGAKGAEWLDLSFFNNVGYIIEGDRRGNSDIVTSIWGDICSKEFIVATDDIVYKYGFVETQGMLTDVAVLSERCVGKSCINLSVGYHNPHTFDEYVIVEEMFKTTQMVGEIIDKLKYQSFPHLAEKPIKHFDNYYDDFNFYGDDYKITECICPEFLIDLDCEFHNSIVSRSTDVYCSCGTELIEKEKTYYCPVCDKHYLTNLL